MAYNFRQQSRIRKFAYLGIIFALFTVSLFHRRLVIEPEANFLELREIARGEADLSGSAVRLLLTGSSGLATTFLWSSALDLQEKHQFNKLKLVVDSITKIQPHFSTPWIFQSWNLAFNVAVEFDSPRDKYFYVSEGLNLLARGERANQGRIELASADARAATLKRGNPDMRWFLGFTYQLKMGTSDENSTMRCLLDLSCIEPSKRDPEKLQKADPRGGKTLKMAEFTTFCQENPRLVRRLHDALNVTDPLDIVQFLRDNAEVPGRFVMDTRKQEYVLRDWQDQFPVLPLPFDPNVSGHPGVPNPKDPNLTSETTDVFLMSRTWYEYAQLPLPPPSPDAEPERSNVDELKYRQPKRGWVIIFRGYPARGQFYIAETLQKEGWFDGEGWDIRPWLDPEGEFFREGTAMPIGTDPKYHSGRSWNQAYEFYKDFGDKNGIYISPGIRTELEAKAEVFRKSRRDGPVPPGTIVDRRTDEFAGAIGEGFEAHNRLANNDLVRRTINYDDFLYQADAERTPETVLARKLIYQAKRAREARRGAEIVRGLYEKALPLWRDVLIAHPQYGMVGPVQEEVYEHELDYMLFVQKARDFTEIVGELGSATLPPAIPVPALGDTLIREARGGTPYFRMARGPLEFVQVYEGPNADAVKHGMNAATVATALNLGTPFALPAQAFVDPLVREGPRENATRGWRLLLDDDNIRTVRGRRNFPSFD